MRKKNSPQYHSQKHPTTRGPHPHTIANSEIHTNLVSRAALRKMRDFDEFICCVDKMRRERNIGKRKGKFVLCTILENEKKKRLERANGQKCYG
jgi:hypothetical protein